MKNLYVIVDNRYSLAYQGVQGGHAAIDFVLNNDTSNWNNNLIYLQTDNVLECLKTTHDKVESPELFYEPDVSKFTAFACLSDGEAFKELKLMGK